MPGNQQGMMHVLMIGSVLLLTCWLALSSPFTLQRPAETSHALATAKAALLAYASEPLASTQCEFKCPRPGDLPCPDLNNDGVAETSCNLDHQRLGRFPWKTLGTRELRDAAGERLWYAVSAAYKNNTRSLPLNAATPGGLTVRGIAGHLVMDATTLDGAVAVLLAPMQALTRLDGVQQRRSGAGLQQAQHYLDVIAGEDNANAVDMQQNGFIQQPAQIGFNDVLLVITAEQIHHHMQQRVLMELAGHLACTASSCPWPSPAAIEDKSCLGTGNLTAGQCLSANTTLGRLPLDSQGNWPGSGSNHPLSGSAAHHWFQQNGWRELVFYQPGIQQLSLVAAGAPMLGQTRQGEFAQTVLANFLEPVTRALFDPLIMVSMPETNDVVRRITRP